MEGIAQQIKPIDWDDALYDFAQLRTLPTERCNTNTRIGTACMDYYFFAERLKCRTRKNTTFLEWYDSHKDKEYVQRFITNNNLTNTIDSYYRAFCLYSGGGALSAFKPNVAKFVYDTYKPTHILDFSAGWGGRCISAMACRIPYTGFDTNVDLRPAYERVIHDCSGQNISIHFADSSTADFSKIPYDMVFTSPPYFKQNKPHEIYPNMPNYTDNEHFLQTFYNPVLQNAWKFLQPNGVIVLNIPKYMLEDTEKVLGTHTEKIPMAIQQRHDPNRKLDEYMEYLYVWRKPNQTPRNLPPCTITHNLIEVRKSSIPNTDMLGVFAKVDIPRETIIAPYYGKQMTMKKFTELYGDDMRYTYQKTNTAVIVAKEEPYRSQNIANYINESKNKNVMFFRGALWSRKNINAGDELFLTYPDNYPRDYVL